MSVHPFRVVSGVALALAASFAAYRSWSDARFAYIRSNDVPAAHVMRPTDSIALGKFLDDRLQRQREPSISDNELAQIRAAIEKTPLARALLRIVGIQAELAGNKTRADTAIALSDALSRRDALTQLALIERSVSKNDMEGALRHYHAALSVHPELGAALYPILARAISYPEVRKAIRPYLARQAPWTMELVNTATMQGNPADVAALILPVREVMSGEHYESLNARLITRLAETGSFVPARQLSEAVIPRLNTSVAFAFEVSDATVDKRLGMLSWVLADDGHVLAGTNGLGGFDVDVEPMTRGAAAMRIVPVSGGRSYTFSQTVRGVSADASATLNWAALCVPATLPTPIWEQNFPASRETKRYQATIQVPTICKGLKMILTVRGPEGQQPSHVAFETLDLRPVVD